MKLKYFGILTLVVSLLMTACAQNREPITAEQFNDTMVKQGYVVLELTGDQAPEGALNALIAMRGAHKIEYYKLNTSAQAVEGFNSIQAALEKLKKTGSSSHLKKTNRFSYMDLATEDMIHIIARVSDTLLLTSAPLEEQEAVVAAYEALGYNND